MEILTGNELLSGATVYLDGAGKLGRGPAAGAPVRA
jgi:hypothetical protein